MCRLTLSIQTQHLSTFHSLKQIHVTEEDEENVKEIFGENQTLPGIYKCAGDGEYACPEYDSSTNVFMNIIDGSRWCVHDRKHQYLKLKCRIQNDRFVPEGSENGKYMFDTGGEDTKNVSSFTCRKPTFAERHSPFHRFKRVSEENTKESTMMTCKNAKYLCADLPPPPPSSSSSSPPSPLEPMRLGHACTPKCNPGYTPKPNQIVCSEHSGGAAMYPTYECLSEV